MREPGFIKRAPRVDTHMRGTVADSDGGEYPVVVTDISREGCRMETDGTLVIGEEIQIRIDRYGVHRAQIRWALGDEAGAVFLDPVMLP
ncbi:PilZ domain-containing protein [Sphingomonas sp.]|uniref:PilZ domain-containing protein n=1 Tax=Sphingomonas sp. TaxID=28214 RepID=UPI00286D1A3E|nr:PilZ domain-containing protein [Sphingomonas sp.]